MRGCNRSRMSKWTCVQNARPVWHQQNETLLRKMRRAIEDGNTLADVAGGVLQGVQEGSLVSNIKTWSERCEEHPRHQSGMVSHAMIQGRMQEEIDELRAALERKEDHQMTNHVLISELEMLSAVLDDHVNMNFATDERETIERSVRVMREAAQELGAAEPSATLTTDGGEPVNVFGQDTLCPKCGEHYLSIPRMGIYHLCGVR